VSLQSMGKSDGRLNRFGLRLAAMTVLVAPVVLAAGAGPAVAASGRGAPILRATPAPGSKATMLCPGCSYNWSGYAQVATRRHTFTEVTDTVVVPTVTSSIPGTQVAADWVGIGGYSDGTLVQAGIQTTASTIDNQTSISYDAWTEILPQAEKPLSMTVAAGDTVTITVQEVAKNSWLMQIQDGSQVGSRTVTYRSKGLSAEAVHERPCVASPCRDVDHLASLTQTSNVAFGPGSVSETAPGSPPVTEPLLGTVSRATLHELFMVGNNGTTVIATPSPPDAALNSFTVADGAAAPAAPSV
jgi:hypothetical protein